MGLRHGAVRGHEPNELTTLELPVVLKNFGLGSARIEYGHYLMDERRQRPASDATRREAAARPDYGGAERAIRWLAGVRCEGSRTGSGPAGTPERMEIAMSARDSANKQHLRES